MSMRLWWLHAVAQLLRIIFVLHFSLFCVKFSWNLKSFFWDQFFRFFFSIFFCFIHLSASWGADGSCGIFHNTSIPSLCVDFHLLSTSCERFSHFWLFSCRFASVDHCEVPTQFKSFSTPFMRSEIEREIKSVRRNPSRSVQLSQNIWRKAFQALASFGESIKVENFVLDRSVGWCSRFDSNLSLLCYVIYHSILPFGRSSWVEISTISYN